MFGIILFVFFRGYFLKSFLFKFLNLYLILSFRSLNNKELLNRLFLIHFCLVNFYKRTFKATLWENHFLL